jgi:hypothetical protein
MPITKTIFLIAVTSANGPGGFSIALDTRGPPALSQIQTVEAQSSKFKAQEKLKTPNSNPLGYPLTRAIQRMQEDIFETLRL